MRILDKIGISVFLIKSADLEEISEALDIVVSEDEEDYTLCYYRPIEGLPFSVRIFSPSDIGDMVFMPDVSVSMTLALKLIDLAKNEARYHPAENSDKKKGWEIRKSVMNGKPVAVALAKWV
jgi:hypothetical protein